jgi:Tfp pilus assembly protein PilF
MDFLNKLFGKKQPDRSVQQSNPTAKGEDLELLNQAIKAFEKDNKSKKGLQALKKAIEINPGLAKAHQILAMHYVMINNVELARKHFDILESLDRTLAQQLLNSSVGIIFER